MRWAHLNGVWGGLLEPAINITTRHGSVFTYRLQKDVFMAPVCQKTLLKGIYIKIMKNNFLKA